MLGDDPRFYIVRNRGLVLEFDLETEGFSRGSGEDFAELARVMENPYANEEAEVWATSLRFSSITDSTPRP